MTIYFINIIIDMHLLDSKSIKQIISSIRALLKNKKNEF